MIAAHQAELIFSPAPIIPHRLMSGEGCIWRLLIILLLPLSNLFPWALRRRRDAVREPRRNRFKYFVHCICITVHSFIFFSENHFCNDYWLFPATNHHDSTRFQRCLQSLWSGDEQEEKGALRIAVTSWTMLCNISPIDLASLAVLMSYPNIASRLLLPAHLQRSFR